MTWCSRSECRERPSGKSLWQQIVAEVSQHMENADIQAEVIRTCQAFLQYL